jgi:hypothetical protein
LRLLVNIGFRPITPLNTSRKDPELMVDSIEGGFARWHGRGAQPALEHHAKERILLFAPSDPL